LTELLNFVRLFLKAILIKFSRDFVEHT